MSETQQIDPVIIEAVENVGNRFGAQGLCDLIALARGQLATTEEALTELSDSSS